MTVGERIKRARKSANLTQVELGQRCGMADSAIRKYESGRISPKIPTLQRIADALDVPIGELLGTIPQPDREYENLVEILRSAGLSIEGAGYSEGPDEGGDHFYIWHDDAADPEKDRVELTYRGILRIVNAAVSSAEARKIDFLRKRLDADLF